MQLLFHQTENFKNLHNFSLHDWSKAISQLSLLCSFPCSNQIFSFLFFFLHSLIILLLSSIQNFESESNPRLSYSCEKNFRLNRILNLSRFTFNRYIYTFVSNGDNRKITNDAIQNDCSRRVQAIIGQNSTYLYRNSFVTNKYERQVSDREITRFLDRNSTLSVIIFH